MTYGGEQRFVAQASLVELGCRSVGEELRAQPWHAQRGVPLAKLHQQDLERFVQVGVCLPAPLVGQPPEASDRIEAGVTLAGIVRGIRRVEKVSLLAKSLVLGHEQEY